MFPLELGHGAQDTAVLWCVEKEAIPFFSGLRSFLKRHLAVTLSPMLCAPRAGTPRPFSVPALPTNRGVSVWGALPGSEPALVWARRDWGHSELCFACRKPRRPLWEATFELSKLTVGKRRQSALPNSPIPHVKPVCVPKWFSRGPRTQWGTQPGAHSNRDAGTLFPGPTHGREEAPARSSFTVLANVTVCPHL